MTDVVRAVAALFKGMATLNKRTTGQFNDDYRQALEYMDAKNKKDLNNKRGQV